MKTALVIAQNTISEAMRRKILNAFLIAGIAVICLTFMFGQFSPRQELTLIRGMGLGIINLVSAFITIILSINLIPTEIERRTIYTVLSKPVRRFEFLLGKWLGAIGTIGINVLLMSVAFVIAVAIKQIGAENPANPLELLKGSLMTFMQMILLCSLSMCFSIFFTPLVNFFFTTAIFIIGNLSSFTNDLAKTAASPIIKTFFTAIHLVTPNFGNFQFSNPLVNPELQVKSEALFLTQNVIYALVYAAFLLIIAVIAFDRREV
jgi:ABC-type transport system involved in multi-copper enzyme maturation permease subunit